MFSTNERKINRVGPKINASNNNTTATRIFHSLKNLTPLSTPNTTEVVAIKVIPAINSTWVRIPSGSPKT